MLLAIPALVGAAPPGQLDVALSGLRSDRGAVRVCLTPNPDRFPDCKGDPAARQLSVRANDAGAIAFAGLPSGDYALAVIHDENGNARLDTFARIPREGFGFSRNPAIRFGPPRFSDARFRVGAGAVEQDVRIRYIF